MSDAAPGRPAESWRQLFGTIVNENDTRCLDDADDRAVVVEALVKAVAGAPADRENGAAAHEEVRPKPVQLPRRLACPSCGWDGADPGEHWPTFRYLEEVTNEREVEAFCAKGVLQVAGEDHIALEDAGSNQRLLCGNCLAEFPVPDDLEVEFG